METHTSDDRGWPSWAGRAAAAWSLGYALLGLYWSLGGVGFPFGTAADENARDVSLLQHARPETTGPAIWLAGLAATALALAMARGRPRGVPSWLPLSGAGVLAAALTVVVPDYRPLLALVRLPVLLVGAPFGWPEQVQLGDYARLFMPWPVANQLVLMTGGVLWWATAVSFRRHRNRACLQCGRVGVADDATAAAAARWGRRAVAVAVAVPLAYAATRWAWALDVPFGLSQEGIRQGAREMPGVWIGGALLASMGAIGALLTWGLIRPWGEVYPRWLPRLGGRPVRPRTAIIPATVVAIFVTSAGLMYVRSWILGAQPIDGATWGLVVPQLFWPLWGCALAVATFAYHLRRRSPCRTCRRPVPNDGDPSAHPGGRSLTT